MTRPSVLAQQIHARPGLGVLSVTGGGSPAISDLLGEPGASRTVLEAVVPYAAAALVDWLGGLPDHFCSAATARAMAMAAYRRAQRLATGDTAADGPLFGLGCTASLASDRPKRGPHRVHAALQTAAATVTHSLELEKGARSRSEEERLAADLLLNLAAEACDVADRLALDLRPGERLEEERTNAPVPWQRLLAGQAAAVCRRAAAAWQELGSKDQPQAAGRVVFPGAFHPLHAGHREMAMIAADLLGQPAEFEISVENVDKPPLDFTELAARAAQFADAPLWFTRAPTFVEKARLFPGATFVVGADTVERIGEERYYGSPAARDAALEELAALGTRFLVFGRMVEGRFCDPAELALPPRLASLCRAVPAERFRRDISSTELRRQAQAD
jgi:hypothetical protein